VTRPAMAFFIVALLESPRAGAIVRGRFSSPT
jgi:hypothetical protein